MPAPTQKPPPKIPTVQDSPTMDVVTAGALLGIRATKSYELASTGQLAEGIPVIKVGAKFRVPTQAVRRFLQLDDE